MRTGIRELRGGGKGIRTPDPDTASVVLYQLSYTPRRNHDSSTECYYSHSATGPGTGRALFLD